MSFWQSELGQVTGSQEDAFSRTFRLIPDGTMALACISDMKWGEASNYSSSHIQVVWKLTDGEFKGQLVTQKIHANDSDPKKRHRSLNMLKLIYMMFNVQPKHSNAPTDEDFIIFKGKIAGIKIQETEPNDEGRQFNWVSEVHKAQGFKSETGVHVQVTAQPTGAGGAGGSPVDSAFDRNPKTGGVGIGDMDDDIPF